MAKMRPTSDFQVPMTLAQMSRMMLRPLYRFEQGEHLGADHALYLDRILPAAEAVHLERHRQFRATVSSFWRFSTGSARFWRMLRPLLSGWPCSSDELAVMLLMYLHGTELLARPATSLEPGSGQSERSTLRCLQRVGTLKSSNLMDTLVGCSANSVRMFLKRLTLLQWLRCVALVESTSKTSGAGLIMLSKYMAEFGRNACWLMVGNARRV